MIDAQTQAEFFNKIRRKRSLAEKRRICGIWIPKLAFKFCSAVDHRDPVVASVLSERGAYVG